MAGEVSESERPACADPLFEGVGQSQSVHRERLLVDMNSESSVKAPGNNWLTRRSCLLACRHGLAGSGLPQRVHVCTCASACACA